MTGAAAGRNFVFVASHITKFVEYVRKARLTSSDV